MARVQGYRRRPTRRDIRRRWENAAGAALIAISLAGLAGMFYLAAAHDCRAGLNEAIACTIAGEG